MEVSELARGAGRRGETLELKFSSTLSRSQRVMLSSFIS